jgi:hypothetical protein
LKKKPERRSFAVVRVALRATSVEVAEFKRPAEDVTAERLEAALPADVEAGAVEFQKWRPEAPCDASVPGRGGRSRPPRFGRSA